MIVAAASAAILSHLRTLFDLNDRLREHQRSVSGVLNRVALLHTEDFERSQVTLEGDAAALRAQGVPGVIEVTNHTPDGRDVPPIDQAYTPFQRYALAEQQYRLMLLMPGLRPPR